MGIPIARYRGKPARSKRANIKVVYKFDAVYLPIPSAKCGEVLEGYLEDNKPTGC
jgi:hypothetical protein